MERERGTARISGGAGRIDTAKAPTPVTFNSTAYPDIVNGSDVYFWRVASDPSWAAPVVLADAADKLVNAAIPAAGVTRAAAELLFAEAARFGAEAQSAPTAAQKAKHLRFAKEHMVRISKKLSTGPNRAGVAAVRSILL